MVRPADGIVELTKQLALLANQQPGVADDVDEQDVSNLEPERAFGFSKHKTDECKIPSNETTARSKCSLKLPLALAAVAASLCEARRWCVYIARVAHRDAATKTDRVTSRPWQTLFE